MFERSADRIGLENPVLACKRRLRILSGWLLRASAVCLVAKVTCQTCQSARSSILKDYFYLGCIKTKNERCFKRFVTQEVIRLVVQKRHTGRTAGLRVSVTPKMTQGVIHKRHTIETITRLAADSHTQIVSTPVGGVELVQRTRPINAPGPCTARCPLLVNPCPSPGARGRLSPLLRPYYASVAFIIPGTLLIPGVAPTLCPVDGLSTLSWPEHPEQGRSWKARLLTRLASG